MTKCERCYHNKVCINGANYKNAESCIHFKDKDLIAELPCKAGDKVFMTTQNNILEMEVIQIKISAHWTVFDCVHVVYDEYEEFFYERDIGKSVFLTREEAEAVLEGKHEKQ